MTPKLHCNWVDYRFLATDLETAGFELEFRKWINMLYHNPPGGGAGEWEAFRSFRDRAVYPAGLPPVSFSCPRFGASAS